MTEPIPAATVVLTRDAVEGIEVLMLRRNSRGAFGGMWVFPGGQVDPDDAAGEGVSTARRGRRAKAEWAHEPDPPARSRPRPLDEPHIAPANGVMVATWVGDAAYDDGDLDKPGARHRLAMLPDGWRYESTV